MPGGRCPQALDDAGIKRITQAFKDAAVRALAAGMEVVEIHAAHGYLLHEFLSPISNVRTDNYGGVFENRIRLLREVVAAVRTVWRDELPLFVRLSATDWVDGGWTPEETVQLAKHLHDDGADLIDCSTGGNIAKAQIPIGAGYQVRFAEEIKRAGVPSGAVGMITSPQQADTIIRGGQADVVFIARELLRDPHWPLRAARELRVDYPWPPQYLRAKLGG